MIGAAGVARPPAGRLGADTSWRRCPHVRTARPGRGQRRHRLADAQPAGVAERAVVRDDGPADPAHCRVREGPEGALRGDPRCRHALHGGRRHQGLPQVADREQGAASRGLRDARRQGAPDDLPDPPHAQAGAGLGAGRGGGLRPVADPELRSRDRQRRCVLHPGLSPYRPLGRRRRHLFPAAHRGRAQGARDRAAGRALHGAGGQGQPHPELDRAQGAARRRDREDGAQARRRPDLRARRRQAPDPQLVRQFLGRAFAPRGRGPCGVRGDRGPSRRPDAFLEKRPAAFKGR